MTKKKNSDEYDQGAGAGEIVMIDAAGYRCPMPVILMEKALRSLKPGAQLQITSDDPVAVVDIPHFARIGGHSAERRRSEEGTCVFLVTAGGNPA